jgi:hypothetical protein
MSWKIDHQCPQCGGPITLEETDRFFVCGFCRVSLYITSIGPFQYYLPPREMTNWLVYVPYWRFKGTVFAIRGADIHHRILDTSRIAAAFPMLPFSLGVRPQTQHLKFAAGNLAGEFIRQSVDLSVVLAGMENQLKELGVDVVSDDTLEKAYIGETVSLIYTPFRKAGSMWLDAINEKYQYLMEDSPEAISSDQQTARTWSPKFLSAMCPDCGWDLSGERESCAFVCRNCTTAWSSSIGGLKKMPLGASLGLSDNITYVPFWRIRPQITGADVHTYADLVRFANLPKVVQSRWESEPLFFWVPAFKIVPNVFLRLGGMLTISPVEDIIYDKLPLKTVYPVTLSQEEAEESLKIIFASLVVSKRKNYARLPDIHIKAEESELILLPFISRGNELIYEKKKIAIQKVAMTYGRNF